MLQGSYMRETVLKFCLREPKQWQKSVLRKHEPTLFHFVPKLTACLHQEQLIATISLLWKENFCWKPWDVMTRDREFKTTPITERVCSPKAQSEHSRTPPPTRGHYTANGTFSTYVPHLSPTGTPYSWISWSGEAPVFAVPLTTQKELTFFPKWMRFWYVLIIRKATLGSHGSS